jgi:hypothetical protein
MVGQHLFLLTTMHTLKKWLFFIVFYVFIFLKDNVAQSLPYQQFFEGKVRKTAKTNFSKSPIKTYNYVGDLLQKLPTDDHMRRYRWSFDARRVTEEDKNVRINEAYIYYIKKEKDGDFHIVIGDFYEGQKVNLLTIEVSGLPDERNPSYAAILATRKALFEEFPNFFEGTQKSARPRKRFMKVAVEGSLFFDFWHDVIDKNERPKTVWEIHPLSKIEMLGWEYLEVEK